MPSSVNTAPEDSCWRHGKEGLSGCVNSELGLKTMKKRVFIVNSHHHVVKEWFRYHGTGAHLLSFDYHTDFFEAFLRKTYNSSTISCEDRNLYLSKHIQCRDLDAAIKDLRNDEHIDFALNSGMIEKAFVFSHNSNTFRDGRVLSVPNGRERPVQARIFSYCEMWHPLATPQPYDDSTKAKMAKLITTDQVLNEVIDAFREYGFNQDNYILDFDCDFIRDKDAMKHCRYQTLQNLINGAKSITIAREPACVYECSGQALSYEDIEDWLVTLIKVSCDGNVEIVEG